MEIRDYYEGRDRSKWQSGVPTFGRVRYREIYPGIDLVYHGENGRLEFDFEVAPGVSPAEIALALDGAKKITLQADAGIDIDSGTGTIRLQTPGCLPGDRRDASHRAGEVSSRGCEHWREGRQEGGANLNRAWRVRSFACARDRSYFGFLYFPRISILQVYY